MHAAAGDRAEALRVYARCRDLLREELASAPRRKPKRGFSKILQVGNQ